MGPNTLPTLITRGSLGGSPEAGHEAPGPVAGEEGPDGAALTREKVRAVKAPLRQAPDPSGA